MSNIFLAESKKIWKPKIVLWYLGITFSFVLLWIWAKYKPIILHSSGASFQQAIVDNQKAEGLSSAFFNLTPYFYMITVAIFASNISREYSLHTWKNIFIYQPQRVKVIFQKCLALITFSSLIILFNFIFSILVTLSIAGYGGIKTNNWLSSKNLLHSLSKNFCLAEGDTVFLTQTSPSSTIPYTIISGKEDLILLAMSKFTM